MLLVINIHFYAFLKNASEKTLFQKGTIVVNQVENSPMVPTSFITVTPNNDYGC